MDFNNEKSKMSTYLKTGTDAVIKESQKLLEVSRLNLDILSMRKEIDTLYTLLGKCIYKGYIKKHDISKHSTKYCEEISKLSDDIAHTEKAIYNLKST